MSSIFHYTSTAGLLGILSSETLFATDYRFLNDASEGGVIRDLVLPILETEIAEITPKLIEKNWLKQEFYNIYGHSGHRLQAEQMYTSLVRATNNVSPYFVVSFCKHVRGQRRVRAWTTEPMEGLRRFRRVCHRIRRGAA